MSGSHVSLPKLTAFLLKDGWSDRSGKKRLSFGSGPFQALDSELAFRVFEKRISPSEGPIKLVVRIAPDGQANERDLHTAVEILAALAKTTVPKITAKISGIDFDTLSGIYPRSQITLARAHEIVSELRNLLTQTANAEENPEPFLPDPKANSITEEVLFGHTFAGSFGFRVECPVVEQGQILIGQPSVKPMERRVLERLATGFLKTEESEAAQDLAPLRDSYQTAFNANVCDAILRLAAVSDDGPLVISFGWSSMFPEKAELQQSPLRFELTARKVSLIKETSEALKAMIQSPPTVFTGSVVALSSDVPPLQMSLIAHRKITVQVHGGDYTDLKMQVEVSDTDYRTAFDAHGAGKFVELRGVPKQRGKHWRIEGYSDFRIL